MSGFSVWSADSGAADALARLEREAFGAQSWGAAEIRSSFDAPHTHILFAGEKRADPVGFAIWRDLKGEAEIVSLGVLPAARNKGAGRALVRAVLAGAKAAASNRVFLEADIANMAALGLYRSVGFVQTGVRRAYYRNGADAVLMEKAL